MSDIDTLLMRLEEDLHARGERTQSEVVCQARLEISYLKSELREALGLNEYGLPNTDSKGVK